MVMRGSFIAGGRNGKAERQHNVTRLLDGRIRTIKDGRWLRTRREWVEAYVATKTIKPLPEDRIPIKAIRGRRKGITLKKGGMGYKFLMERQKASK